MNEAAELAALVGSVAKSLVVVANDGLGNEASEVVVVGPADTLNGDSNVGGGDGIVANTDIRADEVGLLLGEDGSAANRGGSRELGEVLVGHLDELLVGDATGANENHAVGGVVVLDVVHELGTGDVTDVLTGAEDGAAEGLVLVSGSVEVVEDDLLELLLNLLRLAKNNVALALDSGLLKLGVLKNVLENIDALGDVLVESLGKVNSVLALCSRVSGRRMRRTTRSDEPRCRR